MLKCILSLHILILGPRLAALSTRKTGKTELDVSFAVFGSRGDETRKAPWWEATYPVVEASMLQAI